LLNEIEDMKLNDVTVKQKTETARLTALLSNINVMSAEMDKAKASVEFKMSPNNEEGSYC
jgi:hypothetical protein